MHRYTAEKMSSAANLGARRDDALVRALDAVLVEHCGPRIRNTGVAFRLELSQHVRGVGGDGGDDFVACAVDSAHNSPKAHLKYRIRVTRIMNEMKAALERFEQDLERERRLAIDASIKIWRDYVRQYPNTPWTPQPYMVHLLRDHLVYLRTPVREIDLQVRDTGAAQDRPRGASHPQLTRLVDTIIDEAVNAIVARVREPQLNVAGQTTRYEQDPSRSQSGSSNFGTTGQTQLNTNVPYISRNRPAPTGRTPLPTGRGNRREQS